MKVNTDGILLGAWTSTENTKRILDIGTGSGLIALMLAQKATSNTKITALEIDILAANQAKDNAKLSPWSQQIEVLNQDLLNWQTEQRFDLIVSNPPFFSQSLKNPTKEKAVARHNDSLTFEKLLFKASTLATENARFYVIIPFVEMPRFMSAMKGKNWLINDVIQVKHNENKAPFRCLLQLEHTSHKQQKIVLPNVLESVIIRDLNGDYSTQYRELTKTYYLNF